jgi:hypothetical protein
LPRHLGATLLASALACAIAAPLSAAETTIQFTSTPKRPDHIDLGLPEGKLGIGRGSFTLNRKDEQALEAARRQAALQERSARYQTASTELSNRVAAIQALLTAAQGDKARLEEEINARMVERYKSGDAGELEFLLSGDGLSDLIHRGELLEDQSARDRRTLQDYELTEARITQYQQVLEELRDITGEQAARLDERAKRLDDVLVSARIGHTEDEAPPKAKGKDVKGTWYVMDGAFQAQLFLPNAGSGYDGGTLTPARKPTPLQIRRVLADPRIDLDASGYNDVLTGQIDGRLLDAMVLAAQKFNYIKITALKGDHGTYTTSGNVSEHSYGCAMDIGTIGSTYITPSAQTPGGEVNQAVLFFNGLGAFGPDLAPHQVISLFDLGGATLALGDHGDHIHVGYHC